MFTKDEIFDRVMEIIDNLYMCGCLLDDEIEYINELARQYWAQS